MLTCTVVKGLKEQVEEQVFAERHQRACSYEDIYQQTCSQFQEDCEKL